MDEGGVFDAGGGFDAAGDVDGVGAEGPDRVGDVCGGEAAAEDEGEFEGVGVGLQGVPVEGEALATGGAVDEDGVDLGDLGEAGEVFLDGGGVEGDGLDEVRAALLDQLVGFIAVELDHGGRAGLFGIAEEVERGVLKESDG